MVTQAEEIRVFEIARYNIPEKIIESWISEIGENLLPVQERATRMCGIRDGNKLVISTLTGERPLPARSPP